VRHLGLFRDQGGLTVNGGRSCLDLGFEGLEGNDFLLVHIALFSGSDIGQVAGVLDQGGLASLKLAQLLTHRFSPEMKKPPGQRLEAVAWVGCDLRAAIEVRPTGRGVCRPLESAADGVG